MTYSEDPDGESLSESVTLGQARQLIRTLAHRQSLLLLSAPGVGKSDTVAAAAAEAGLPCRSLLGTQIAPEDVSGIPRIVGERSVFCPPRVLLPETNEPFCLFLDELPACTPDIQKAFYSLLLERRIGEHKLPAGTWVVAAGNRATDRALVRTISSALINRVILLHVRVDNNEWLEWAAAHGVRREIIEFIRQSPDALCRAVPREPVPFSTPRAWAMLSRAIEMADAAGILDRRLVMALAAGRISWEDVQAFVVAFEIHRTTQSGNFVNIQELLRKGTWELDLSVRAVRILENAGITIVQDLIAHTESQLSNMCRELDAGRMEEIKEALSQRGLCLGMKV
jgi:hypothetical protein